MTQLPIDFTAYTNRTSESQAALRSIDHAGVRTRIHLAMFRRTPPEWTSKELENELGMLHETVSSQLRFMERDGWVVKTEQKRTNDTGRKARVYRAVEGR